MSSTAEAVPCERCAATTDVVATLSVAAEGGSSTTTVEHVCRACIAAELRAGWDERVAFWEGAMARYTAHGAEMEAEARAMAGEAQRAAAEWGFAPTERVAMFIGRHGV